MQMTGNTVLITGGATGIGLALAERFLKAGNQVIICGRREAKLEEARARHPELHTRACDLADPVQRAGLAEWLFQQFPHLNVVVQNAGIQQRTHVLHSPLPWSQLEQEIQINFAAPVHLTQLLLPHLVRQPRAAVIHVSSGLALAPAAWAPVYSATKAALHSYTVSLRIQLEGTAVEVVEVLPPAVNTDLGGPGLHTFGVPVDAFADAVFAALREGRVEIGYGGTEERLGLSARAATEAARQMWAGFVRNNPGFTGS
ncbi:SDR family oxidoreductase [Alicyclobacillus macrosporangiidus]|uniref:SDR family oxidoreductase n=1 Tax=Alicyclobacillus macrosporangiidus TaxID=392015 RepID=UPI0004982F43|nr:SDR family NAD(P)-dependent oxidoreductase [Alicyclobacillus macrosporangiidus]MCL6598087.1 SDR family NAD(P)-dependent oxidoreductase [Alicyclobacillus macrosporangiidus]